MKVLATPRETLPKPDTRSYIFKRIPSCGWMQSRSNLAYNSGLGYLPARGIRKMKDAKNKALMDEHGFNIIRRMQQELLSMKQYPQN